MVVGCHSTPKATSTFFLMYPTFAKTFPLDEGEKQGESESYDLEARTTLFLLKAPLIIQKVMIMRR